MAQEVQLKYTKGIPSSVQFSIAKSEKAVLMQVPQSLNVGVAAYTSADKAKLVSIYHLRSQVLQSTEPHT